MEHPLVSVIIPAYNCSGTICKAVDSALLQNVPMEILVLDDGSKDGLDGVMQKYQDTPCVRYLKNEQNMGAAATRNRGALLAQGEYIAYLDADDYWAAGKLEKQLRLIRRSGTVLCATARELLTPDGKPTGHIIPVKEEISYRELLKHNSINCSSVLIRTDVAREFPMQHEDSHEDYIMWLQILKKYHRVCAINEPLLKYRLSSTGKSGSKWKSAQMTFRVYRYMGFSPFRSAVCFCSYALHGVWKYFINKS